MQIFQLLQEANNLNEGKGFMKKYVGVFSKMSLLFCLIFGLFSSMASAHVSVNPPTSIIGAWETYSVKVPVEKDIPTTKFTLKIPSGVEFESYQPVAGWNFSSQKDQKGNITAITFESSGTGILPGQFQQFIFTAKNPDKAEQAAWDAYQYYQDGSVVEWTGDEGAKTPHSITDFVAAAGSKTIKAPEETEKAATAANDSSSLPLILSIAALLLSLVSLITAVRKKS